MKLSMPLAALVLSAAAFSQDSFAPGAVYTMTNASSGNEVAIFDRAVDGVVTFDSFVSTGGTGTDASLGNQAGVLLSDDERFLFVVNAGSNDLSVFEVQENGLMLVEQAPTLGQTPVSVAQRGDRVYVAHAGSASISGFELEFDGQLTFLPASRARLSGPNPAPAQISFGPRGQNLYVTEKARNVIDHFPLDDQGLPTSRRRIPSNGGTPFGFAFGTRGQLFVSEANAGMPGLGAVSAYELVQSGSLSTVSASVPNGENATCWVVASPDGRVILASNTGTDSISTYSVGFDGTLSLLDAAAANTGAGPLDVDLTPDGRFFYVLNAQAGGIGDYRLESDGSLTGLPGSNTGLPSSSSGLAAR